MLLAFTPWQGSWPRVLTIGLWGLKGTVDTGAHLHIFCSSGGSSTEQRANGRCHHSRIDKYYKSRATSLMMKTGHQRMDLFVAVLREYRNYISQDSYKTRLPNLTQLHLYRRRWHNAAKPSQGTDGKSSWWGVYTTSYPATWKDELCRESMSRQWKLQPMLLCRWSLGFVFWRK